MPKIHENTETGVQRTTDAILFAAEKEAEAWHLQYADVVRALTAALHAINEKHREKTGE